MALFCEQRERKNERFHYDDINARFSPIQQQTSSMSSQVATSLFENSIMDHCLAILNRLMEHWQAREKTGESEENVVTLLKPQHTHSPPDMSPFFLKQYVKVYFC